MSALIYLTVHNDWDLTLPAATPDVELPLRKWQDLLSLSPVPRRGQSDGVNGSSAFVWAGTLQFATDNSAR